MQDDKSNLDEFQSALEEEFAVDLPEKKEEVAEDKAAVAEDEPKDEVKEEIAEEEVAEEEDKPKEGEKTDAEKKVESPQFATKSDVIDAMREYSREQTDRATTLTSTRDEVIKVMHPEGVDTTIYDTNGSAIKTANDIVSRQLLNPNTNEPFTYEEATSWLMNAQKQMSENLEELHHYAEEIAETNISLQESNNRVMQTWGDVLNAMPNVAKQVAETYVKTLEFDPTGSYVVKAPVDPVAFYDMALAPYMKLAETMTELETARAENTRQEEVAERDERIGLPRRGAARVVSNTGNDFVDALIDELNS